MGHQPEKAKKKMFNKNDFLCDVSCFASITDCAWIPSTLSGVIARFPVFFVWFLFFYFLFMSCICTCFFFFSFVFFFPRKCLSFKCMKCCVQTNFRKVSRIFHSLRSLFFFFHSSLVLCICGIVSFWGMLPSFCALCGIFKMTSGKVQSISH